MILKNLHLYNFRNYKNSFLEFSPKINIFLGENAQGKTNLLEAIYLLSTGKSFRTEHLRELIFQGASHFCLVAEVLRQEQMQKIALYFDGKEKRLKQEGVSFPSFLPLLGFLPSVLNVPSDVEIISGSPSMRRRFLNFHLAQRDPLYLQHFTRYWKALRHRNVLLKNKKGSELGVWEEQLEKSGSYLMEKRMSLMEELEVPVRRLMEKFSSKEQVRFQYKPSCPGKNLFEVLKKNREKDLNSGFTQIGPHRDDFEVEIDQRSAKVFASEGQKRTLIAALKFAEWELFSNFSPKKVLMGIDDFGVHLDGARKAILQEHLEELGQVFLTTPLLESFRSQQSIFFIKDGEIKPFSN